MGLGEELEGYGITWLSGDVGGGIGESTLADFDNMIGGGLLRRFDRTRIRSMCACEGQTS